MPIGVWIALSSLCLTALGSFIGVVFYAGTMKGKLEAMSDEIANNRKGFETLTTALQEHKDSPTPHVLCPAHSSDISNLCRSFDEMKDIIKRMDSRIYNIAVKNGVPTGDN